MSKILIALLAILVAACGGGGEDHPTSSSASAPTAPVATPGTVSPVTPTPAVPTVPAVTADIMVTNVTIASTAVVGQRNVPIVSWKVTKGTTLSSRTVKQMTFRCGKPSCNIFGMIADFAVVDEQGDINRGYSQVYSVLLTGNEVRISFDAGLQPDVSRTYKLMGNVSSELIGDTPFQLELSAVTLDQSGGAVEMGRVVGPDFVFGLLAGGLPTIAANSPREMFGLIPEVWNVLGKFSVGCPEGRTYCFLETATFSSLMSEFALTADTYGSTVYLSGKNIVFSQDPAMYEIKPGETRTYTLWGKPYAGVRQSATSITQIGVDMGSLVLSPFLLNSGASCSKIVASPYCKG